MNDDDLNSEYQNLSQKRLDLLCGDNVDNVRSQDTDKRMRYIVYLIQEKKTTETMFTSDKDDVTVIIKTSEGIHKTPGIDFSDENNERFKNVKINNKRDYNDHVQSLFYQKFNSTNRRYTSLR